jgi:hypothetical protein
MSAKAVATVVMLVIKTAVLTPDGADSYTFSADGNGVVTAAAPASNHGSNLRKVLWIKETAKSLNASSCATWRSETTSAIQQGAALRIVKGDGYTRAVTVSKNIYFGATWIINLHVWDSRKNPAFRQIGQFDLSQTLRPNGTPAPLPWRLCARALGSTLEFKVWRLGVEPEPAWDDVNHGGKATIPAKWVEPGKAGLYVGHIPAGGSATYSHVAMTALS